MDSSTGRDEDRATRFVAVEAPAADAGLRSVAMRLPEVGALDVLVRVVASGVCGADVAQVVSSSPDGVFPVVPGHEVAGVVEEVGVRVDAVAVGERVAVGWFGGSCGQCRACRAGDVVHCPWRRTPGRSYPGGWAQYVVAPVDAIARIPEGLRFVEAAPFGCAGVTSFNAIRNADVPAGGRVAIFGLGGVGHLAAQFSSAMGYETVVIARGAERAQIARQLGADRYLDSSSESSAAALAAVGGADLIVYTASDTAPAGELIDGLATHGRFVLVGVDGGRLDLPVADLVRHGYTVSGHLTGSPRDTEDAMRFAVRNGVRPLVERFLLPDADVAVQRVLDGQVRFRAVLEPWGADARCM